VAKLRHFTYHDPYRVISAFINNTPVVAVFIPIILAASAKAKISASKFLYLFLLPPCLEVFAHNRNINKYSGSSIAEEKRLQRFGMFEMAPLGLIFFATEHI
jgi:hypothetical protein